MNKYSEDSIQSLGILGGVRAKPVSIGLENHNHTFIEILANAIDEHREGYGNLIKVFKHIDGSVTVQDYGRSVPMDKNSKGEYSYKKVFDELWSGGKYKNNEEDGDYQRSLGTNGCGSCGTNYTSEFFEVTAISPNGYKYYVKYKKGIQKCELVKLKHNLDYTGTIIHWIPSEEVFRGEGEIDNEFIEQTLEHQSIVNKGLKFIFTNEKTNETKEYYYENGVIDYINELGKGKNFIEPIQWETESKGKDNEKDQEYKIGIELTFAFNNEYNHIQHFHNSSWLEDGGTPDEYIRNGFVFAIDKLIKSNNKYNKNEKKINFEDVKDSLILVSNSFSTISIFTGQSKKKIQSEFMKTYGAEWLKEQLEVYFIEHPLEAEKIMEQVLINKRSREKAESTRLNIKKKLQSESKGLRVKVENLEECDMKKSTLEERELWLCEGLSAASTISEARDSRTMGTFALGGKFIASLKNNVEAVLNNKPAIGIIQALGCGIEIPKNEFKNFKDVDTFDISKLRYGKVIIACDQDFIGFGIALSLVSFFYKFMPTLLKQNRINISMSPRYEIRHKDELLFAYGESEKENIANKLSSEGKKFTVGIVKGLGELNKDVYWDYVMNPDNRILKQLIYDEQYEDNIEYYFNTLIGEDIVERKKFVKANITHLDTNLID